MTSEGHEEPSSAPVASESVSEADSLAPAASAATGTSPYFSIKSNAAPPLALGHIDQAWLDGAPHVSQHFLTEAKETRSIGIPDVFEVANQTTGQTFIPSRFLGVDRADWRLGELLKDAGEEPYDYTIRPESLEREYVAKSNASQPAVAAEGSIETNQQSRLPSHTLPATYEELLLARPHPDAFFLPKKSAWFVCSRLQFHRTADHKVSPVCRAAEEGAAKVHALARQPNSADPRFIVRLGQDATFGGPSIWGWPTTESNRMTGIQPATDHMMGYPSTDRVSPTSEWWDTWACHCAEASLIASPPLPGVFDEKFLRQFESSRLPAAGDGRTQQLLAAEAWLYVFRIVKETVLFGVRRPLRVSGKAFMKNLGWDYFAGEIFARLGYTFDIDEQWLVPPDISRETEESCLTRAKLIRAWVEIGLLLCYACTVAPLEGSIWQQATAIFQFEPARSRIAGLIGGNTVPVADVLHRRSIESLLSDYATLGATPFDPGDYLFRAFQASYTKTSSRGPSAFQSLDAIAEARESNELRLQIGLLRSQGAFTQQDLVDAYNALGLPPSNDNAMDVDQAGSTLDAEQISDEQIVECYQNKLTAASTPEEQRIVQDAVSLIKRSRDSEILDAMIESVGPLEAPMTIERAQHMLGIQASTEDDTVSAAYFALVAETPDRATEIARALEVVAEDRQSAILRELLRTGGTDDHETWDALPPDPSRPVGLRNLGNTCFLNSLLQYLFTISELREIVLKMTDFVEPDTVSGIALSKRVGGRAVTAYEIERSKRFLSLLSQLFHSLVTSQASSVTPERELEFLALETSIRPDEPAADPAEIVTSAGEQIDVAQDSTLVAEPVPIAQGMQSLSVLGKRRSENRGDAMDVDVQQHMRSPLASRPATQEGDERPSIRARSESLPGVAQQEGQFQQSPSSELIAVETADGVTEIGTATEVSSSRPVSKSSLPPKLPPRRQSSKGKAAKAALLYGRQNDVSECLDAILFKLEVALDSSKVSSAGLGIEGSIVRKLFQGKTRQVMRNLSAEGVVGKVISDSADTFKYLLVDAAREGSDLYDALDRTFDEDMVEWEGAKASRRYTAQELPPLLQIQLQRVQYDTRTKRTFKSNAFVALPPVLRMDRYLDADPGDPPAIERQRQSQHLTKVREEARERLISLQAVPAATNSHASLPDLLSHSAIFLEHLSSELSDTNLSTDLEQIKDGLAGESEACKEEIANLEGQIATTGEALDQLWAHCSVYEYELVSVFMHRGEANFGHYFLYQRTEREDGSVKWLKLNDEQVSEVSCEEVFKNTSGTTLNPYWLSYARRGVLPPLVQAVARNFTT